jgi:5'-phosphate synthase pdxT subunit
MNIAVERNAYGRQIDSRVVELEPKADFEERTGPGKLEAVFIRAPIIRKVCDDVRVLAEYAGDPVLIEEGRHMAATFHPELTRDDRVHRLFLEKL